MTSNTPDLAIRRERVYSLLLATFVVVLVLTNIIGVKLFVAFPNLLGEACFGGLCTLTSGIITYPLTFLLTDTVSELYGRKRADFMVLVGFIMSLMMLGFVQAAVALPGSPIWVNPSLGFETPDAMQKAYLSVFTLPTTLVFGSMSAYLGAQMLDNRMFHYWRNKTRGRHLWLRNNASTMVSQAVDTVIVNSIFLGFGLGIAWPDVVRVMIAVYLFKLVIAAADTPLVYLLTHWLRPRLGLPPAHEEYEG